MEQTSFMALGAVIFDYGMVLSAPPDPVSHQQMVGIFGTSAEAFEKVYWAHRHAYDEGKFDGPEYWQICAAESGVTLTAAQISHLIEADIRMWTHFNQPMVDWALLVHQAGFRTGILSNIGKELANAVASAPWVGRLDHNTWSYSLKIAKPDPAIYHAALQGLGVKAAEALFIDDRQENVSSAQAVGLQAVLFRDVQKLGNDLERLGLASGLPPVPLEEPA